MRKILQKIPFAARLYFFLDIWAVSCAVFAFFFIISRAKFEDPRIASIVLASIIILVIISAISAPTEYGILGFLGIKGKKDAQVLNNNIDYDKIDPNVSDETLKNIFDALLRRPKWGMISGFQYGIVVIPPTILIAFFAGAKPYNILVVFIGIAVGDILLIIFANFFIERFISDVLKQCQQMMQERGIETDINIKTTLKNRFNYFLALIFVIFVILLTFTDLSLSVIGVAVIGLVMVILASRTLFASIYDIFQEVESFVGKMPKRERSFYRTGNFTKESVALSQSLNKSAEELYNTREDVLRRQADLEKFYKLLVGRELRMVELKKEIKEGEEETKKREEEIKELEGKLKSEDNV